MRRMTVISGSFRGKLSELHRRISYFTSAYRVLSFESACSFQVNHGTQFQSIHRASHFSFVTGGWFLYTFVIVFFKPCIGTTYVLIHRTSHFLFVSSDWFLFTFLNIISQFEQGISVPFSRFTTKCPCIHIICRRQKIQKDNSWQYFDYIHRTTHCPFVTSGWFLFTFLTSTEQILFRDMQQNFVVIQKISPMLVSSRSRKCLKE